MAWAKDDSFPGAISDLVSDFFLTANANKSFKYNDKWNDYFFLQA